MHVFFIIKIIKKCLCIEYNNEYDLEWDNAAIDLTSDYKKQDNQFEDQPWQWYGDLYPMLNIYSHALATILAVDDVVFPLLLSQLSMQIIAYARTLSFVV